MSSSNPKNIGTYSLNDLFNPHWIPDHAFLKRKLLFIWSNLIEEGECNFHRVQQKLIAFSMQNSFFRLPKKENMKQVSQIIALLQNEVPKYNLFHSDQNYDMHAEPHDERFENGGGYTNETRSTAFFNDWFPMTTDIEATHEGTKRYFRFQNLIRKNEMIHSKQDIDGSEKKSSKYSTTFQAKHEGKLVNTHSLDQLASGMRSIDQSNLHALQMDELGYHMDWNQLWKEEPDVTIGKDGKSTSKLDENVFQQLMSQFNNLQRETIEKQNVYLKRFSLDFSDEMISDITQVDIDSLTQFKYRYFLYLRELDRKIFEDFYEKILESIRNANHCKPIFGKQNEVPYSDYLLEYYLNCKSDIYKTLIPLNKKIEWPTIRLREKMIHLSEKMILYLSQHYYIPWIHSLPENPDIIFPWVRNTDDLPNFESIIKSRLLFLFTPVQALHASSMPNHLPSQIKSSQVINTNMTPILHSNASVPVSRTTFSRTIQALRYEELQQPFEKVNNEKKEFYFKQELIFHQRRKLLFHFYKKKLKKQLIENRRRQIEDEKNALQIKKQFRIEDEKNHIRIYIYTLQQKIFQFNKRLLSIQSLT